MSLDAKQSPRFEATWGFMLPQASPRCAYCPRGRRAECLSYYFFPTPRRDADLVRRGGGLTDAREVLDILFEATSPPN